MKLQAKLGLALLLVGGVAVWLHRRPTPAAELAAPSAAAPDATALNAPAPNATTPSATAPDEEAQLMAGAERALAAGDTDRAFSLLYEQATKFPHGRLAARRDLTHVRTLCRAGKVADARDEAASFSAHHADPTLQALARAACPSLP